MTPNINLKTLALAGVFVVSMNTAAQTQSTEDLVQDASADGFTIQFARVIEASPESVYRALTTDLGNWWLAAHTWYGDSSQMSLTAAAGGCFCERSADGRETEHLRVIKVEPNAHIRLQGGLGPLQGEGVSGVMDWRLQETDENTTTLTVFYRVGGYTPNDLEKWAAPVGQVLQQQMNAMVQFVEQEH